MQQRVTPVVLNLIFINVIVFLLLNWRPEQIGQYTVLQKPNVFGFYYERPASPEEIRAGVQPHRMADDFKPVQIVGYFFSHFGIFHLVFNMLALFMFGSLCETVMGQRRFIEYYLFSGVFSGVLLALFDPSPNPVLGASGAISGLLVILAYYYPNAKLSLMFIPIEFTARTYAITVAAGSALLIVLNAKGTAILPGISHFGHLAGMVAGFLFFNKDKIFRIFKR